MAQPKVIVVGGSGFIGQALQAAALDRGMGELFAFTYNEHPEAIKDCFPKIKIDLSHHDGASHLTEYGTAIFVAGNSDAELSRKDPWRDLDLNVHHLLNLVRYFRGNLVLLSSQSVYYGLDGKMMEEVNHVPVVPQGISKRAAEEYAQYLTDLGYLEKLWIFRLRYAFGPGERSSRLIPVCNAAATKGGTVTVQGMGKSLLNPLPSEWVGEVLLRAAETLSFERDRVVNITNLNHPDRMNVAQVVRILAAERKFDFTLEEKEENWPVTFWGDTERLSQQLKIWRMTFPDIKQSLRRYFAEMRFDHIPPARKDAERPRGIHERKVPLIDHG